MNILKYIFKIGFRIINIKVKNTTYIKKKN